MAVMGAALIFWIDSHVERDSAVSNNTHLFNRNNFKIKSPCHAKSIYTLNYVSYDIFMCTWL